MHSGQQTPRLQKLRVAGDSFIEQLGCLRQLLPGVDWIRRIGKELLGAQVKVVRREISGGRFLDRRLFAQGDFGLKLVGDLLGDLALDCEYIR